MRLPYVLTFVAILYVVTGYRATFEEEDEWLEQRSNEVNGYDAAVEGRYYDKDGGSTDTDVGGYSDQDEDFQVPYQCATFACKRIMEKRGLFSMIVKISKAVFKGAKVTLKFANTALPVASLSYTIINIASEGCAFRPSICTNRKKIEVLERECYDLVQKLKGKFEGSARVYEVVREASINNIYLEKLLEGVAEQIDQIFSLSEIVDDMLSGNLTNANYYNSSTADEWLDKTLKSSEYRLNTWKEQMKGSINAGKESLKQQLALTFGMYAATAGFKSVKKAFKASTATTRLGKMGNALKSVAMKKINFVKNFRSKVYNMAKQKMTSLKNTIKNPKGAIKNYSKGISLSNTFINAVGVAASAVIIFMENKQWEQVAKEVSDAVINYERYKKDLQEAWNNAQNESETLADMKVQTIDAFNQIVQGLSDNVDDIVKDNTAIIDNLRPGSLPTNIPRLITQSKADASNVLTKQVEFLGVMKDTMFDLKDYKGWIQALNTIVKSVHKGVSQGVDVPEILDTLTNAFQFQSPEVKQYSSLVSLPSVICVLSFLFPDAASHGTYPLASIRPTCVQGTPKSLPASYIEAHKILAIEVTIRREVDRIKITRAKKINICTSEYRRDPPECAGSIHDVQDALVGLSKDPLLTSVHVHVPPKDIMHIIAAFYPNDAEFAFFDLNRFRGGKIVTDNDFEDMTWHAEDAMYDCQRDASNKYRSQCRSRG